MSFSNAETNTVIECSYDHRGRRATKKVTVDGAITLHQRYIYRGYLQIACCDLTRANHPALWLITWDPIQSIATRPLAIQKDGTWYTYGWDLTKNICELYSTGGAIRTAYTYSPYGSVTESGNTRQPIQWSSEFHDTELGLIYYNYRHYNPLDGRWIGRDPETEVKSTNLYYYVSNNVFNIDYIGKLNLGKLIYSTLNKTSLFIDGGCISASISFDKITPIIMIGPFPLRFYISLTGATDSCCDKNTKQTRCFLSASLTVEAYAQLGNVIGLKNKYEVQKKRHKDKKINFYLTRRKKLPAWGLEKKEAH